MKITVNQPESENVEAVFVDGKRCVTCIEADDEEGYVVLLLPPTSLAPNDPRFQTIIPDTERVLSVGPEIDKNDWQTVRVEGTVEIVLKSQDGLEDQPLKK